MEFRNLTPFSSLNYFMLNQARDEFHVVVAKVGYRLHQQLDGVWQAVVMDDAAIPLCIQDEYRGEMNISQVVQESDLAPLKPRCDVIINGTAYAPGGVACPQFPVSVRLDAPDMNILLEKTLLVTGERYFYPVLPGRVKGTWKLSKPEPFTSLPLDYRYAFGGECRIAQGDKAANRVEQSNRLTEMQQKDHPDQENIPVAHTAFQGNPLGRGYVEGWYLNALRLDKVAAPRIVTPQAPYSAQNFTTLLQGKADLSLPVYQPAGLGIVGRTWQPRLAKAGTYDDIWLKERHPYLPDDFDFGYWNSAPQDQQIAFPPANLTLTLTNLTPEGELVCELPNHMTFILLRMSSGEVIPQTMFLDTLLIDADNLTVSVSYRYVLPVERPVRVMELRYEVDPARLLAKLSPPKSKEDIVMADNYMARKDGVWKVVSILPDVCKTPMGSATPPVPYPVIAELNAAAQVVPSVKVNGKPLVVLNQSYIPTTIGDQAGVANGLDSGTVGGKCHPKKHSDTVKAGKRHILRHGDEFWMNGK
ncbi:DUF2169 domain-containing protein [Limnobaculum zhutongyuii]|nr:DUF2169 domain-containing protein [Limnobaculum zhutongyuii]